MLQPFSLENFTTTDLPPEEEPIPAYWFVFFEQRLLVREENFSPENTSLSGSQFAKPSANSSEKTPSAGSSGQLTVPHCCKLTQLNLQTHSIQFLGWLDKTPCYTTILSTSKSIPPSFKLVALRKLYGTLETNLFAIAGRALQIIHWHRTHQFCSACATPLIQPESKPTKHCPACKQRYYPKLSPAIIVRVTRGEEILLARSPRFRPGMYSVLAGFVEPGESLEETVMREVKEEVGITVKNISYFGSRPWPFPNSLMLAFTAEYAAGELLPEPTEIEEVAWFSKGELPEIPGPLSIAHCLIQSFLTSA